MIEKITIDRLTALNVSVVKEKFTEDGEKIGEIERTAYTNSALGREIAQNEVPEPYLSAIMTIWGDNPVVNEKIED